jgi:hypothetical protein
MEPIEKVECTDLIKYLTSYHLLSHFPSSNLKSD